VTISASASLPGLYDYGEVARSVLIAIAASYAALDLAGRVTAARDRSHRAWLGGGAIAMGIGIWEMHFKGMMAFRLPVSVKYHWPTILAALLAAIVASAAALYVASRQKMGPVEALTGGVIMSSGIAGLHYLLMAAMRSSAIARYSPMLVTCSILLAIFFSLIALLMAFGLREETRWSVPRRLGSAAVLGAAVSAMHYTGMAAATFFPASPPELSHAVSVSPIGNSGVVVVTLMVLVAALVTSSVDRRAGAETTAALQTGADALVRAQENGPGKYLGLRGGSFSVEARGTGYRLTLREVRWSEDVTVSGQIDSRGMRQTVRAALSLQDATSRHGTLSLRWQADDAQAIARISGRIDGRVVRAAAPLY